MPNNTAERIAKLGLQKGTVALLAGLKRAELSDYLKNPRLLSESKAARVEDILQKLESVFSNLITRVEAEISPLKVNRNDAASLKIVLNEMSAPKVAPSLTEREVAEMFGLEATSYSAS